MVKYGIQFGRKWIKSVSWQGSHWLVLSLSSSYCQWSILGALLIQGSHATWKTLKTVNLVIYFFRPGKFLEFDQKVWKAWNFNSQPETNLVICKFSVSRFPFKMLFTKSVLIYIFFISTLSINTKHWFKAKLN